MTMVTAVAQTATKTNKKYFQTLQTVNGTDHNGKSDSKFTGVSGTMHSTPRLADYGNDGRSTSVTFIRLARDAFDPDDGC